MVKEYLVKYIVGVRCISDRIMAISFLKKGQYSTIISAYAPTNTYEIEHKMLFYDQLNKLTANIPKYYKLFVCGDYNARVGRTKLHDSEDQWHGTLGNYGIGKVNENGILLLEYCTQNDLRISNMFFKHKHRGTWKHQRSSRWHQLDHIRKANI